MTLLQTVICDLGLVGIAAILAGFLSKGRVRTARAFTCYLAWMLGASVVTLIWPERFYNWDFWVFRQASFDALELAVVVELGYWCFLGFPGAASSARIVVLALLVAMFCALALVPVGLDTSGPIMGALRARMEIGTAWSFAALSGLTMYYDIPVRPIHRAIMLGMVVKLVVFGEILQVVSSAGPRLEAILRTAEPMAFVAITFWWAWVAWKPEPALQVDAELAMRLQPWRAR